MSKNRYLNTKFWSDNYVSELDPIEKLLFIYLLTNEKTTICGIYELPLKYMAIETGIEKEMIIKIIKRFEQEKKIFCYKGWVCIANFIKHQNYENQFIEKGIKTCLSDVPEEIVNRINASGGLLYDSSTTPIGLSRYLIKLNFNYNINKKEKDSYTTPQENTEEIPLSPYPIEEKLSMKEKRQSKKYLKLEKENKTINELFAFWNSLKIIKHVELRKNMESGIRARLKKYTSEQIKQSMKNYALIVKGKDYYFDHEWCLEDFLSRGEGKNIERFLDLKRAKKNFSKNKQNNNAGVII